MSIFTPIQQFSDLITYNLLSLDKTTHLANALNFFIYDSIKIVLLLLVITQIMSFINVIFPVEKIRDFLAKKKLYWLEYFLSSFFWAITPFCSCSSIPLFVGFLKWGIPLWLTFTFLITSPLVNEVALAIFLWAFWLKVTLIYMFSWIILGMVWWYIIWKLKMEKQVADFIWEIKMQDNLQKEEKKSWKQVWKESSKEWIAITKKIIWYVLAWVAIWWLIHGYVPEWFFREYITKDNPFAVPISVILGIPMYSNASGIIPVMQSLVDKGIPLWTALAFMMAVVGLSFPEFLILKKVMKLPLLLTFFGVVGFFIILLWYFFNMIF